MNARPFSNHGGSGARFTTTADLFAFSHRRGGAWRHPWQTHAFWNTRGQRWVAIMEPGFVNEESPRWRTTIREQAEVDRDFGINPLTGQPFFSAHVFAREKKAAELRTIDVPMYLAPAIPMAWRAVGTDGDPSSPLPSFFARRGVAQPPRINVEALAAGDASALTAALPKAGARLLRACDLWIRQPRMALTSTIELLPGPATGISNVTQTLSVRSPIPGDRLRLYVGNYSATRPVIDPLAGDYEEPTWDDVLVATVFLLSPAGTPAGSEPDGTWTPFVRHNLFWNLCYDTPDLRLRVSDGGGTFIPPLAAGAAQLVINFLTASLNDMTNQALNILNAHSLAGSFWTATGGGHDARPIVAAPVPVAGAGATKAGRQARRAAQLRAEQNERLDPAFPFRAEPFDTGLIAA